MSNVTPIRTTWSAGAFHMAATVSPCICRMTRIGFYAGKDPGAPLLSTTSREALVLNPDKSVRHYFYLQSEHGEGVILAERLLALKGAPNFRDLGGYEGEEGRKLRWGKAIPVK